MHQKSGNSISSSRKVAVTGMENIHLKFLALTARKASLFNRTCRLWLLHCHLSPVSGNRGVLPILLRLREENSYKNAGAILHSLLKGAHRYVCMYICMYVRNLCVFPLFVFLIPIGVAESFYLNPLVLWVRTDFLSCWIYVGTYL
jgi:hypothetical protein